MCYFFLIIAVNQFLWCVATGDPVLCHSNDCESCDSTAIFIQSLIESGLILLNYWYYHSRSENVSERDVFRLKTFSCLFLFILRRHSGRSANLFIFLEKIKLVRMWNLGSLNTPIMGLAGSGKKLQNPIWIYLYHVLRSQRQHMALWVREELCFLYGLFR